MAGNDTQTVTRRPHDSTLRHRHVVGLMVVDVSPDGHHEAYVILPNGREQALTLHQPGDVAGEWSAEGLFVRDPMPRTMIPWLRGDGADGWEYEDEHGDVWLLRPTGERLGVPFTFHRSGQNGRTSYAP